MCWYSRRVPRSKNGTFVFTLVVSLKKFRNIREAEEIIWNLTNRFFWKYTFLKAMDVDTGFTLEKSYFWIHREIEKIRNTILNNKPMFLFKFIRHFNAAQLRTIATFLLFSKYWISLPEYFRSAEISPPFRWRPRISPRFRWPVLRCRNLCLSHLLHPRLPHLPRLRPLQHRHQLLLHLPPDNKNIKIKWLIRKKNWNTS